MVFDEYLVVVVVVQFEDWWWYYCEGEVFLQFGDFLVDFGVDFCGSVFVVFIEGFEWNECYVGVGCIGELQCVQVWE